MTFSIENRYEKPLVIKVFRLKLILYRDKNKTLQKKTECYKRFFHLQETWPKSIYDDKIKNVYIELAHV